MKLYFCLAMEDAGTYGMGIEYAKAMLGENYTETAIAAEEEIRKEGRKNNLTNIFKSKDKKRKLGQTISFFNTHYIQ